MKLSIAAVICAAGSSGRMGGQKKEYLYLPSQEKGITVLAAAVSAFALSNRISAIAIAVRPGDENAARSCLPEELLAQGERIFFVPGVSTRQASVHSALSLLEPYHPTHVLIHDGARPWITEKLIEAIIDAAIRYDAVIPVLPLLETPKELNSIEISSLKPAFIERHLKRAQVFTAQTPQGFKYLEILKAHVMAAEREGQGNACYTDDAELWGEFIGQVAVIPGEIENRKITYPEDMR